MPLQIIRQDITKMQVDAIVNSTNRDMVGYSGIDLAVHTLAGEQLDEECKKLAPLGLGNAVVTKGYGLPTKYIIHTSGPIWRGGNVGESIILKSCYMQSLKKAVEYKCRTVAFPLISSGAYGFPKDRVLKFAVQVITEFLFEHELTVYLCVFDKTSYEFSKKLFCQIQQAIDDDGVEQQEAFFNKYIEASRTGCMPDITPFAKSSLQNRHPTPDTDIPLNSAADKSLDEYLKSMDKPFAYKLFDLIDEKGMTDVACYKKANVDKKTFSKIKCNPQTYKPSKQTAVAFAVALELNMEETQDLLASAGLTLSKSFTFDKIIRFFIQNKNYDIFEINEALFEFDQVLLGC